MAIAENDGFVEIVATGGETELDFDFELLDRGDMLVLHNGVELTLNLQYSIQDESLNDPNGGVIELEPITYFPSGAVAGDVFTIICDPPASNDSDFQPGGGISYSTLNNRFDRIWQYLQKLTRDVSRSALVDETELGLNLSLPLPEEGSFIGW
ncbi:MAG: hypothetical protein HGA87_01730, partial [Desulfobulbaceae bacterium]|nr:hypothetical protein [Desulfobulbaceae bacterium]